jgi:hypothetical protein
MVLRMPCPTKRKGSNNWYYCRTIPIDVQRLLTKLPKERRPHGWYKTHISISLGTSDRAAAKGKCAEVAAEVEHNMSALREGPKSLTLMQITRVSGLLYQGFAQGLEDDPILSHEQWLQVAELNKKATQGRYQSPLAIRVDAPEDRRRASMELRFGAMTDALLRKEGLVTDEESRWRVIEALGRDLTAAAEKLARNAGGDYSPDKYAERFPAREASERSGLGSRSLGALVEAWEKASLARGMRPRDVKRWRSVLLRFREWLGHDDLDRVRLTDVQGWGDERNAAGVQPKTINDTYFAALRAAFKWGRRTGWLNGNPEKNPADGARIEGRGKVVTRDKYFSEEEAGMVVQAASRVVGSSREHSKTTAAKKWVPWLLAYTGARIAELIQLRRQDVRCEGEHWIIRLTPEAGSIKTNKFRDVPVHEHLVELGFLNFVRESATGHLFSGGGWSCGGCLQPHPRNGPGGHT